MRGLTGADLLRRPVQLRGIQLGRSVDLLLHPQEPHALGLDVLCGDERHRFLPVSAAQPRAGHIEAASSLVLLDLRDDSFYRLESRPLSTLRGARIDGDAELQDVVFDRAWRIVELVVDGGKRVPLDGIALPSRRSR